MTRKRAASLADKTDGRDEQSDGPQDVVDEAADITPTNTTHSRMSSSGASAGSAASAPSHVCLCQPDPKIPRPRNAFILYRQHHQAAIVAQNPGLANPDISKIIGEQWKAQPESVRNEWKALAEEEKIRHQQQYPEYRYQPRRGGRRGSLSSLNTNPDKHQCNKCGGRSITTPTTPFPSHNQYHASTAASAPSSNAPMLPPPTPSSALTPSSRYLPPMMSNLAINTAQAQAAAAANNGQRRNTTAGPRPTPNPLSGLHIVRNNNSNNHRDDPLDLQILSPLSPDAKRRRFNSSQPYTPQHHQQPPLPVSATTARTPGTPYPFPSDPRRHSLPRPDNLLRGPSPRHHGHPHNHLTLPPLQTAANGGRGADPQSRSVEAMVMSMPFWGKIRVLGKIAPPHRAAANVSVRGAIVAVEGDDEDEGDADVGVDGEGERGKADAVAAMGRWLEESLNKTGETWAQMAEAPRGPAGGGGGAAVGLGEYVEVIAEWHGRSKQMVEFITRAPEEETEGTPTATTTTTEGGGRAPPRDQRTPVLIMPTYNLRAADAWASRIPITDNYSPADHWQWVATLWRGIVGPDITIYIKDVSQGEMEMTGGKAVEVREDGQTKCLIVKRVGGKDIEESALRRLGFEVGEMIRSVSVMNGK